MKHRNEKEWLKTTVMVSVQDDAACYATTET